MPRQKKQRPGDVPFDKPIYLITSDSSDDTNCDDFSTETANDLKEETTRFKQEQEWDSEGMTDVTTKIKQKKAKTREDKSRRNEPITESNDATVPLNLLDRCLTLMEKMERRHSRNKCKRKLLTEKINELTGQLAERTSTIDAMGKELRKEKRRNEKMANLQNNELENCRKSVETMKKELEEIDHKKMRNYA